MKPRITLLALLLCLCHFVQAQETDSTAFYRHHIGINTRVVLDRIQEPDSRTPLQLIYKYQLSPRSAIRVMGEGYYATSDSTVTGLDRTDEVTYFAFGGSVGYEWQIQLSKNFMLYYGADAFYSQKGKDIEISNRYAEPFPSQDRIEVQVVVKHPATSFGLKPFAGLRYNVGSRFYLSSETALSVKRETTKWDFYGIADRITPEGNIGTTKTIGGREVNRTIISYIPFTGVNIHYLF